MPRLWRAEKRRERARDGIWLVMAGLVPAIPIIERCRIPIEIAGTSPAMTPEFCPSYACSLPVRHGNQCAVQRRSHFRRLRAEGRGEGILTSLYALAPAGLSALLGQCT